MIYCSNKNCQQTNPQSLDNFWPTNLFRCKFCIKQRLEENDKDPEKKQKRLLAARKRNTKWRMKPESQIKIKNARSKPKNRLKDKNRELLLDFGISLEEFNKMLLQQNNCCDICKIHIDEYIEIQKTYKYFAVDHNHQTGKIRGLLCSPCNLAFGRIEKIPNAVANISDYINKHK